MGTFSLPQVGDSNSNICRGSNYSDSGGYPYAANLPQQEKTFATVAVEVCGEIAGRWYMLRSYSIPAGEAMDALPHITASLGAAWKAIAEMDAPAAQQPLTDEHKAILKECRDQAMRWTLKARIPEVGAFGGIAQDLDYLCEQLGIKND